MPRLLILLTLPPDVTEQYRARLSKLFPGVEVEVAATADVARPALARAAMLLTFGQMMKNLRLGLEHVERGDGDGLVAQSLDQRRLVDHAATRRIDEECTRLHRREHFGVDHAVRLLGIRRQQHEMIALRQHLEQVAGAVHAVEAGQRPRR